MDKRIVYTRPDGGVSIVVPSDVVGAADIQALIARVVPSDSTNVRVVDVAEVPSDRIFRNAWEDDGVEVKPNMVKAAVIHMGRIRAVRNVEIEKLDVPQMTAISKSDIVRAAAIETQKQKLRDLPKTFILTGAKTPDELKALWPAELPKG